MVFLRKYVSPGKIIPELGSRGVVPSLVRHEVLTGKFLEDREHFQGVIEEVAGVF